MLKIIPFILLLLPTLACSLFQPRTEQGHAWIVPRPAAEIRLTILDAAAERVPGVAGILLFGGEPLQEAERFVDYNPEVGVISDSDGEIVIRYLGETGGGYEVPFDAPDLPHLELELTGPDGQRLVVDLDNYLYRLEFDIGEINYDHNGKMIAMKIVAASINLDSRD
jgi:hypothetical protein